ncbi:PIG-L family deacetylase [Tissierella praeacuta]|uniref:PIG-L deacetylase family protein n=1 Tax=Tissierella praeacuta TaxID=43131 RepID=UPI003514F7E6
MNRVLVVSPHPDDETLGAGGTLLRYKEEGSDIYWINFTNMKEDYGYTKERVRSRNDEINKVKKLFGFKNVYNLELEPSGLDKYSRMELILHVSEIVRDIEPNIILLPNREDIHSDHKIVFDTMFACTKSFRYPSIKKVLVMEIISETDFSYNPTAFRPNYFIDITKYVDKKIEIMKVYESELKEHPFPRSIENLIALAINRGAMAGKHYAEAFMLIKAIE